MSNVVGEKRKIKILKGFARCRVANSKHFSTRIKVFPLFLFTLSFHLQIWQNLFLPKLKCKSLLITRELHGFIFPSFSFCAYNRKILRGYAQKNLVRDLLLQLLLLLHRIKGFSFFSRFFLPLFAFMSLHTSIDCFNMASMSVLKVKIDRNFYGKQATGSFYKI